MKYKIEINILVLVFELLNFVSGFSALFDLKNDGIFKIFDQIKDFKGTVVNRTLPSLHGGSLEITLTVPLSVTPPPLYYNLI